MSASFPRSPSLPATRRRFLQSAAVATFSVVFADFSTAGAAKPSTPDFERVPYYWPAQELAARLGVDASAKRPDGYVRAVYFHRSTGCANCRRIATYVFETVRDEFRAETRSKRLELRYVDFEAPENRRLATAFKVAAPSLVLVVGRDGRDATAKKATRIWELVGDSERFKRYVADEIRAALAESTSRRLSQEAKNT